MPTDMDTLVSLCKRRGFVFPSSEIYGGLNACWDYGPMGVRFKNNLKAAWWRAMTQLRDDVVGLDAAILMHPKVWEASGHVASFTDPLVDCKSCKSRFRADHLEPPGRRDCPNCGGELTEARQFNLMFKTFLGPVEDEASAVYLRPETAQGTYVDFPAVLDVTRKRLPFGIAQVGKAFRNEISPGNFIFRSREFEQMEMQYFIPPEEDRRWFDYWKAERMSWYLSLGLTPERVHFRQHAPDELAHYAREAWDIEYDFPFGTKELEGIHNRGDYDLSRHQEYSGRDMSYFDDLANRRYTPVVIETAGGADRAALTFLCDAYREEEVRGEKRVVLGLHPDLAPYQVAVLPLSKKEELSVVARDVATALRGHFAAEYDETGSIGRRYRRQDEIGTPLAVTVDFESLQDKAATIRERDSMEQVRVPMASLPEEVGRLLGEMRKRADRRAP